MDTKNDPSFGGKANIIETWFNGKLKQIMETAFLVKGFDPEDDLENFGGKEKYRAWIYVK